jgi:DNA polymerase-3 subunit epsilon
MLVVGFDVETTGLDVTKEHITQVGAVLWDTAAGPGRKRAKIKIDVSVNNPLIVELDPKITELTGIVKDDLTTFGQEPKAVFETVNRIMAQAEAIVAHNGNLFDKPMWEHNARRFGVEPVQRLWIDTTCDIDYPPEIQTRKLVHLAAEHSFLNPFPHDAMSDVMTMLKIADRYDWKKIVEWAKSPTLVIRADSTFQQKELVKKQNYRWNNEQKIWTKSIKEFQLADAQAAAKEAGFKVTVLKGGA